MGADEWDSPIRRPLEALSDESSAELGAAPAERLAPLVRQFAAAFIAMGNCEKSGNLEWRAIWESALDSLAADHLPSGSGFDSGSRFVADESRPDRLIFATSFHHMNDSGFYDGWTEHRVIVTPEFAGFDLKVTGRDKRGIKEYIGDSFYAALSESVPMPRD